MKKTVLFISCLLSLNFGYAQAPEGVGYQGVATDANAIELVNQAISIRASVLSGSATGTIEWEETHTTTTDTFGLFTLTIGQGSNTTNGAQTSFGDISWGTSTHFLKIEMDVNGGSNYSFMGTNQMMSVPYALYAENALYAESAGTFPSGTAAGEINYWNGTSWVGVTPGSNGQTLTFCNGVPIWGICPALLSTLNCAGASTTGTLNSGTAASGVSVSVGYTGGNTGSYSAQTISSTGVAGLTASLAAGTLTNGSGSVTYTITGTPASIGTASFAISLGGQSCSFSLSVAVPLALLSSLNCDSTTGSLTSGVAASGVSLIVGYTGGNTGWYSAQTVSLGGSGLTASLAAGTLNNGSGSVTYTITGTPTGYDTVYFYIALGGQSCSFLLIVAAAPQYPAGTVNCAAGAAAIVDVTNPSTGKIWMDRNLGASQVATSSTDVNSYGDLYQWGRRADGHQCRTSATTSTLSSSDQPSHGNFILTPNSPYDWRSPQNTNLWQGVNGVNNPCPGGYRLPTQTELEAERLSWSSNTSAGAFGSPLKLPLAGLRGYSNGSLIVVGAQGYYWSSTVSSTFSPHLGFDISNAGMSTGDRASGASVRCLKD
jgi:uncharacterized protein (TIGR02145 family)